MEDQKISGKTLWDKKCQTYNWVHFVLAISCWEWRLTLRVACIPRETTLEKKGVFPFQAVDNQRGLLHWECGLSPLPLSTLTTHLASHVQVYTSYSCFYDLCEFIWLSVLFCLEGLVSLVSSIPFGSYNLSASSSEYLPENWWEGFDEGFSLRTELSKVSLTLCTLPSYESLYFFCPLRGKQLCIAAFQYIQH